MRRLLEIAELLERLYPLSCQESWDNSGLQVGSFEQKVSAVLVALDLSTEVLKEAQELGVNLILTHHPLFFKPLKMLEFSSYVGNLVRQLILSGISLYSAHTNFDNALGGLNDILLELLGFSSDTPLRKTPNVGCGGGGRIVDLPEPFSVRWFVSKVGQKWGVNTISFVGDLDGEVKRFAVCGGSGAEFLYECPELGVELYITADIKYHDAQFAANNGISLVVLNHFEMEYAALPSLARELSTNFKDLDVYMSNIYLNPIRNL